VNVVTRKLDLDQTSVAHTHTERNKCDQTRGHIVIILLGLDNVDCTGCLRVGTDFSIFFLLPVPLFVKEQRIIIVV